MGTVRLLYIFQQSRLRTHLVQCYPSFNSFLTVVRREQRPSRASKAFLKTKRLERGAGGRSRSRAARTHNAARGRRAVGGDCVHFWVRSGLPTSHAHRHQRHRPQGWGWRLGNLHGKAVRPVLRVLVTVLPASLLHRLRVLVCVPVCPPPRRHVSHVRPVILGRLAHLCSVWLRSDPAAAMSASVGLAGPNARIGCTAWAANLPANPFRSKSGTKI